MLTKILVPFFALAMIFAALPMTVSAQSIGISVSFGPPPIPYYVQPPNPEPNWIWSPGYWAYGPGGYYWVPGTWVPAPQYGLRWTPGFWGWNGLAFVWSSGY
ncbi:MAG TPA: YXWGXW repeat-containing protein [Candidatus Aquilonibacter sp.]